tara:strand:+ start:3648 stop:5423 length:1776 start_codon:yes stop_codon:yes gene_type:complete
MKKSDLQIVNLSTYTSPSIKEVKYKDFVYYGEDNNYFQYLIDRYNGSPTNNAIINGISEMIYGKGLDATDSNRKPDQYAKMVSLFHKDCVRKLCFDLKLMGQCAMQVIYSKDRSKIVQLEHMPIETLRAEKCNDKGEVEAYYYFNDWSKYKNSSDLQRIPAFGTSKEALEIMYIQPYRAGFKYYSPVDYQGGTQYAELEEEISNYHLNNIMNGLAPSMLINFNNGTPDAEQRTIIENRIKEKFSGTSNAGKFILAFNDDPDTAATIDPIQLSDAHNQYQFLSDESARKILVAHRVVSPMLLGIKDNTGLGNNADELKTATILMDNMVIRPFQTLLLDAFDQILAFNNMSLNMYFKTLQPLEFTDLDNVADEETREEETGVKLSEDLSDDDGYYILDNLSGEIVDDEWELVDEREYSEENTDIETWANSLIEEKKTILEKLGIPNIKKGKGDFSVLDKSYYKVRYKYAEKYSSDNTRPFCKALMNRNLVYRIEDIDQASNKGVNKGFGHKGKKYDLFRFKGGVNCGHYWSEQLYRLKKKSNGKYIEKSDKMKDYVETDNIPTSYKPKPRGWRDAKKAPKDMPNNGHHPNYKK